MSFSLTLHLAVAIAYLYIVIAHFEYYSLVDTDIPFIWNLLVWYLTKDRTAKIDLKFFIWGSCLRFHKLVFYRMLYEHNEPLFTQEVLMGELPAFKIMIGFQLMGLLVPKKVLLKISNLSIPQIFCNFMDQTNFTGSVIVVYQQTVQMYMKQNTYNNYFLPSTSLAFAIVECFILQVIGGAMGPWIDMVDHYARFGKEKVKQEFYAYTQSGILIYVSGCIGIVLFELYGYILEEFLAQTGLQQQFLVFQKRESLFSLFMITWWIMFVTIRGFYFAQEQQNNDKKAVAKEQEMAQKVTSS